MDLTEIIIKEIPEDTKKISITAGRVKIIDFGWGSLVEKEIPAISVYAELKNGEKVYRVYDVRTFWERNFIDNGE
ncbi:hypothetical protein HYX19_02155 [Candidatus Woesearchaeota archaeon]|nr:hypothetical protein [Candidatus Woesearchaeota archaeon]